MNNRLAEPASGPVSVEFWNMPDEKHTTVSWTTGSDRYIYRFGDSWREIVIVKSLIGLHAAYGWFSWEHACEVRKMIDAVTA